MNLPFFIAKRYLFAHKSHNVINIISAISAIGMAIGTAALIIILSIYNGFDSLVRGMMSSIEPDLLIVPSEGKVFTPDSLAFSEIYGISEIESICTVLEEQVFIDYDGEQGLAKAKGVDSIYEEETPLGQYILDGSLSLHRGDIPLACVGAGLAYKMSINPRFVAMLEIYYPTRTGKISAANPWGSLKSVKVKPSGIFSVNSDIDDSYILLPIESMRELLEYEGDEVSAVELRVSEGLSQKDLKDVQKKVSGILGEDFKVKNRYEQNESLYKMMKYEKAAIFLILIFIIIIIAFNIFGSLTMLIIEKGGDIDTLRSLGAQDSTIKKSFILEGWFISLIGLVTGLAAGLLLAFLQQQFGIIKMPGNFVIQSYPVVISFPDIIFTVLGVSVIGYIIARLPVAYYFKNHSS